MVSLLNIIEKQLETNPEVIIVRKEEEPKNFERYIALSAPKPLTQESHQVWYHIAPTNGLYTAGELEVFMKLLVPHLKPNFHLSPYENKKILTIGWDCFTENVGITKITVAEELELPGYENGSVEGLENGKRKTVNTYDLFHQRRIVVKTYPNAVLANDMLEGKLGTFKDWGTEYLQEIPKEVLYKLYVPDNHPLKTKEKLGVFARLFS